MDRFPAYLFLGGWGSLSEEDFGRVGKMLPKVMRSGTLLAIVAQDHPAARNLLNALAVPVMWVEDASDALRHLGVRRRGDRGTRGDEEVTYVYGPVNGSFVRPYGKVKGRPVGVFQGITGTHNWTALWEVRARVLEAPDRREHLVFLFHPGMDGFPECLDARVMEHVLEGWVDVRGSRITTHPLWVILDVEPVEVFPEGTSSLCSMTAFALRVGMGWAADHADR